MRGAERTFFLILGTACALAWLAGLAAMPAVAFALCEAGVCTWERTAAASRKRHPRDTPRERPSAAMLTAWP